MRGDAAPALLSVRKGSNAVSQSGCRFMRLELIRAVEASPIKRRLEIMKGWITEI